MCVRVILAVAIVGLILGDVSHAAGNITRPSSHELAAIAAAEGPRLWHHEEEFSRDPALRAQPHHVVILHLEPGTKGGKALFNTIPYLVEETADYSFCVPKKDPHIRSVELIREGSHGVVVHVPRGAPCKTRTIAAGLYRLVVEHDGTSIAAAGKKAFVHVPRVKGDLQAGGTPSSFPTSCDPATGNSPQFTFTASNGLFVAAQNGQAVHTQAAPGDSFLGSWSICPDGGGNYTFGQPGFFHASPTFFTSSGPPSTDTHIYETTGTPTKFKITDLGNGQFTLMANFGGTLYPIVVGSDGVLHWATSGDPAVFTTVLKFYLSGAQLPPLQAGEVALFQGCNYDDSGGTWVFRTNIPDFTPFTFFGLSLDGTFASVKVGPGTPAALYADANYSGTVQFVGGDIPCLGNTPLGNYTASSLKAIPDRQIIAATDECQNCNLSGLDLSGLNLAGGQFQGSTFTGANLTNTNLQSASLNNANLNSATTLLSGTNFLGAILRCTNFSGADLSQATFQISGLVTPILTTDFSCRLDLTNTTLNLTSFPLTDWRYANLSGAIINGITGATLSTTASPLDLSGAIFNHTDLRGAKLDGANFGCATSSTGTSVCTQLIDTNLNSASLKKGSLVNAVLQGANMDFTNLDSANLCSAHLNQSPATSKSASLQGAYLRNVNLYQADLTGAFLKNTDFYSTAATSSCLSTNCGPTSSCASAVKAVLNSTTFTGAYLSGVDFSGATPQGVDFSGAFLVGANFTNANLSVDANTGRTTNFSGAYLQGATFTNALVTDANFTNAYVSTAGATLLMQLPSANLQFPGYQPMTGKTPGCVQFTVSHGTVVPTTDGTNTCPNGGAGSCGALPWPAPLIPLPPLPTSCTSATSDLNWIIPPS